MTDLSDMEDLWDKSKGLLIPGMAAGAGGAGLGAYLTSSKKKGETPSERRKRVVRNALIGAAAGTTAGVAIPAGVEVLADAGSGGMVGDTIEDLVADTALLGGGAALGYGGGRWLSDKTLNIGDEAVRINNTIDDLFNNVARGKSGILAQHMPANKSRLDLSVKEKLRILAQVSESKTKDFYLQAVDRNESILRTAAKRNERIRLLNEGVDPHAAEQQSRKFVLKDEVKAAITHEAESKVRRQMKDIGLTMPDETIKHVIDRFTNKTRWEGRLHALKQLLGIQDMGEAGKIWGALPSDSGKWKSLVRRAIKGGFPGLGLAAGGLLTSNFV